MSLFVCSSCLSRKSVFSWVGSIKDGLISEGILTLVPFSIKGAKTLSWAENLNKLFTVMGRKFKFSSQERDLAPFVDNGTKHPLRLSYLYLEIFHWSNHVIWNVIMYSKVKFGWLLGANYNMLSCPKELMWLVLHFVQSVQMNLHLKLIGTIFLCIF